MKNILAMSFTTALLTLAVCAAPAPNVPYHRSELGTVIAEEVELARERAELAVERAKVNLEAAVVREEEELVGPQVGGVLAAVERKIQKAGAELAVDVAEVRLVEADVMEKAVDFGTGRLQRPRPRERY